MKLQVYRDAKDEWRWRIRADNGRIIAESGEGYVNREHAVEMGLKLIHSETKGIEGKRVDVEEVDDATETASGL